MKCKEHPFEPGAGVCASCLRERLLALVAAQNGLPGDLHRKPEPLPTPPPPREPPPPPLLFPRSVSPYRSHRRSFGSFAEAPFQSPRRYLRRFYSTPQPRHAAPSAGEDGGRRAKLSLLSILFRHSRSEADPDPEEPRGSWLSTLLRGGWRRRPRPFPAAEEATDARTRPWRPSNRGMSPIRDADSDESPRTSGDSTDSPDAWRRPMPTPIRRIAPTAAAAQRRTSLSGFVVCLSPLVRANPRRGPAGGEVAPAEQRHAPGACSSLGPNRSRKLVHIGRL